ncbi:zinc-regulated TonB-dependent outer membrane receptor [Ectothiorhodospiraceae bacterium 2226]|nr:zinc-regulated TonB-dependent outer membrane receptor [Ectothiorhodospiraceae bacterium 2226]
MYTVSSTAAEQQPALPALGSADRITSGTDFNPAISVILDGVYYYDNRGGDGVEGMAGFDAHDDGDEHAHGEFGRGFNLRETELTLSGSVDAYFDALATFALTSSSAEVEEAYLRTRRLPAGLQLKAGRFLSGIGYINEQHPHSWQFVDRPLPYEMLFGDHGLQENGVQLTWLPQTPMYTRLGVELLQGQGEGLRGEAGENDSGPSLVTAFAKIAPDLGFDHALQVGVFGGYQDIDAHTEHTSGRMEDWDGRAWFAGTDWVYKYDAGRPHGRGDWLVQAEYMLRERRYDYLNVANGGAVLNDERRSDRQDGLYAQAVYGFAPRWQAGLRYEGLGFTNRIGGVSEEASHRATAMVTFLPTEFSRLRLQFARARLADDDHGVGGHATTYANQVYLQYQVSLGAHGAHRF